MQSYSPNGGFSDPILTSEMCEWIIFKIGSKQSCFKIFNRGFGTYMTLFDMRKKFYTEKLFVKLNDLSQNWTEEKCFFFKITNGKLF